MRVFIKFLERIASQRAASELARLGFYEEAERLFRNG